MVKPSNKGRVLPNLVAIRYAKAPPEIEIIFAIVKRLLISLLERSMSLPSSNAKSATPIFDA